MWTTFIRRCSTTPTTVVYSHRSGAKRRAARKENSFSLRTPRGTRDIGGSEVEHRDAIIGTIRTIFKNHGGRAIDTPIFESSELLRGKYGGETNKLIYDLAEYNGEACSLRYDLTVPFARYLGANRISKMKRYQIGKVYRREKPAVQRGRFCEFFQCNFDIAGAHHLMLPDAECLKIVDEIVKKLNLGSFVTRVNHRALLGGVLEHCGVPSEALMSVCSSIDKLDKEPWIAVAEEITTKKNIPARVVANLERFLLFDGDCNDMWSLLEAEITNPQVLNSVDQLKLIFGYCKSLGITVSFDFSLARGLDYYTGVIFETVLQEDEQKTGSIAAGGRYDNLVQSLTSKAEKPFSVPCVGLSIGIERIFALLQQKDQSKKSMTSETEVLVASAQKGLVHQRLSVCGELWNAGISAQFMYKNDPKLLDQLQFCEANGIKLAVIVGNNEAKDGMVKLRNVATREETLVKESDVAAEIKKRLSEP